MPDYQLGKIYRIDVDGEIYVGSTIQKLCKRRQCHIKDSRKRTHKLYLAVNEREEGWQGIYLTLIENYPCDTKEMLFSRERYWVEQLKSTLNERLPIRTKHEYREANKMVIAEKKKIYAAQNKEVLSEKRKNYREQNIDRIMEYQREYQRQHVEERKIKFQCPHCQKEMRKDSIKKHIKTVHKSVVS
jgi:hypothetical protein